MSWIRFQKLTLGWALLMLAAFVWFVVRPQQRRLAELQGAVRSSRLAALSGADLTRLCAELESQSKGIRPRQDAMRRRVPDEDAIGPLLEQVMDSAAANHLSDPAVDPLTPRDAADVRVLPLRLNFSCGSSDLFAFLKQLETLERVVRVRELEARSALATHLGDASEDDAEMDATGQGPTSDFALGTLRVSMMVEVYRGLPTTER
ncbi:MAG: type 4a pilus biogenesis protein PilO [Phycisphaerales bacterium]|nr:type 4a pilus biogenesis protein PilO [Phycisphaerales bacterium]